MYAARLFLPLSAALLLGGCADRTLVGSVEPPPAVEPPLARLECTARVREATLACVPASSLAAGARGVMIGGQREKVFVESSNVTFDAATATLAADITLRNLLPQAMGTADGASADPLGIRVFFHTGPSVSYGGGEVRVSNADGEGTFTAARQPFFRYDGILAPGARSAARRWAWHVDPEAVYFVFTLLVDTRLAPALVINEVMANPATASEAAGEWIEIHNPGLEPMDLDGWTLASGGGDAGYAVSGPLVIPRGGYVVLGGSTDTLANGRAPVAHAYSGVSLGDDTGDWLSLRSPAGATVDSVAWGAAPGEAGLPPPVGVSLALKTPAADNVHLSGAGSAWVPSVTPFGTGQQGTPGERNAVPVQAASLAMAMSNGCAADLAGAVWCWGINDVGELGTPASGTAVHPVRAATPPGESFIQVSALSLPDGRYGCALSARGAVYCWGWGWLGYTEEMRAQPPTQLPPIPGVRIVRLAQVSPHPAVCALGSDGKAYCWRHMPGLPGPDTLAEAVPQPDSVRFTWIGSGAEVAGHLCAVSTTGRPYCTTGGVYEHFASGFASMAWPAGETVVALSPSRFSACGVSSAGQAYCWGNNFFGQLGNGTVTDSPEPVAVLQPPGVSFVGISGSVSAACAWTAQGEAWCWGRNESGELGAGTIGGFSTTPVRVSIPAGTGFAEVAMSFGSACARAAGTGSVYCWGAQALGYNRWVERPVPVPLEH